MFMFIKAYANGGSGGNGGNGRMVNNPANPTSVQGRYYAATGRAHIGGSQRGRGAVATYVRPRGNRGR